MHVTEQHLAESQGQTELAAESAVVGRNPWYVLGRPGLRAIPASYYP